MHPSIDLPLAMHDTTSALKLWLYTKGIIMISPFITTTGDQVSEANNKLLSCLETKSSWKCWFTFDIAETHRLGHKPTHMQIEEERDSLRHCQQRRWWWRGCKHCSFPAEAFHFLFDGFHKTLGKTALPDVTWMHDSVHPCPFSLRGCKKSISWCAVTILNKNSPFPPPQILSKTTVVWVGTKEIF